MAGLKSNAGMNYVGDAFKGPSSIGGGFGGGGGSAGGVGAFSGFNFGPTKPATLVSSAEGSKKFCFSSIQAVPASAPLAVSNHNVQGQMDWKPSTGGGFEFGFAGHVSAPTTS